MTKPISDYGVEGPLGFPCSDKMAFSLETVLKTLPKEKPYEYRKVVIEKATSEFLPGELADVSWISSEAPDRKGHVVLARGLNDSQFKLNPVVTLNHSYFIPPVGKSVWRKTVRDGEFPGIKAKTTYPAKPENWDGDWAPDAIFALIQSGLMAAKSIGLLPTKVHKPSDKEIEKNGWQKVDVVIDEWILVEYAVCSLPIQQNAIVEAVSKGMVIPGMVKKAMGLEGIVPPIPPHGSDALEPIVPFTSLSEIEKAIERELNRIDVAKLVNESLDRIMGRV